MLLEQLKFYTSEMPIPQWRFSDATEEQSHMRALVKKYKQRISAVKDFWGLEKADEYYTILYYTITITITITITTLHYTILYYTILYYTILYCTIL